jgi:hypothetical protein
MCFKVSARTSLTVQTINVTKTTALQATKLLRYHARQTMRPTSTGRSLIGGYTHEKEGLRVSRERHQGTDAAYDPTSRISGRKQGPIQ